MILGWEVKCVVVVGVEIAEAEVLDIESVEAVVEVVIAIAIAIETAPSLSHAPPAEERTPPSLQSSSDTPSLPRTRCSAPNTTPHLTLTRPRERNRNAPPQVCEGDTSTLRG